MRSPEKRFFTLEEAQEHLPDIEKRLLRLKRVNRAITFLTSLELDVDDDYEYAHTSVRMQKQIHKLTYQFYKELLGLIEVGAMVKDVNKGQIDFYSYLKDREIFLCWKLGEPKICHWHEIDAGFKGRKKILDLTDPSNYLYKPKKASRKLHPKERYSNH